MTTARTPVTALQVATVTYLLGEGLPWANAVRIAMESTDPLPEPDLIAHLARVHDLADPRLRPRITRPDRPTPTFESAVPDGFWEADPPPRPEGSPRPRLSRWRLRSTGGPRSSAHRWRSTPTRLADSIRAGRLRVWMVSAGAIGAGGFVVVRVVTG